jgi:predicted dehydrogenase
MSQRSNRREFLKTTTAGGLGLWVAAGHMPSLAASANEKLNIAIVGVGGMGKSHVDDGEVKKENVVALCDIDDENLDKASKVHPGAKRYNDFREMFDKQKDIDAVICATPDHCHAVVTAAAMRLGKHVYTQKPLTHTVYEAHVLSKLAAENPKLVTQMGNQGHSNDGARRVVELVHAGVIGPIREVHAWTNRPIWPQAIERPSDTPPVPSHVHWDLWLGPMPYRPYNPAYHPFKWRGWWDFGTGALGDMACHIADTAFWALDLKHPTSIEATSEGGNSETAPKWSIITYEFPDRHGMPPVKFTWYDGGKFPSQELVEQYGITKRVEKKPKDGEGAEKKAENGERKKGGRRNREYETVPGYTEGGSLLVGEKGVVYLDNDYGASYKLLPAKNFEDFHAPPKTLKSSPGHMRDWIEAIKNGGQACSNFEYASALTGMVLLGNLSIRAGKKIEWDAKNMRSPNCSECDEFIRPEYRKGWEL